MVELKQFPVDEIVWYNIIDIVKKLYTNTSIYTSFIDIVYKGHW